MKKYLLSFSVLGVFTIYTLHYRFDKEETHIVAIKSPIAVSPQTASPVPTPADSTQTPAPVIPTPQPTPTGKYKNGSYTGSVADAFYGNIQVKAIIRGGQISDVQFLQYPNDRSTSIEINSQAMPLLTQEAIQAQSAQVDGVSGASQTSRAFIESLQNALNQAI